MKQVTKSVFTGIRISCLLLIVLLAVSCGNKSSKKTTTGDTTVSTGDTISKQSTIPGDTAAADVNCVTLTKTQVDNVWVTLGYTQPGSRSLIDSIRFRSEKNGSTLTVYALGATSAHAVIASSQIILSPGFNCGNDIPENAQWGQNEVKLADLDIINGTGGTNDFLYIRMTPELSSNGVNVRYKVEVIGTGGGVTKTIYSDPCPPLCP